MIWNTILNIKKLWNIKNGGIIAGSPENLDPELGLLFLFFFILCLCGFPLYFQVFSHSPKHSSRLIGYIKLLLCVNKHVNAHGAQW